ncbi:MAG TPA: ABC transporter permease [Bacillota bacterium]|nr:ABC transporter permease [Bacillota bacterium]
MRNLVRIIVSLSLLLLVWQVVYLTAGFPPALLPAPLTVIMGMVELVVDGTLFNHIYVSLLRFLSGYLLAALLGIILGLVLGWYKKVWAYIDPVVQVLRPVSPIAWFPFIVLWFGIGDLPAVVIIFIAAFYPVLLSTIAGVSKVDTIYLKVAQNFGLTQYQLLTKIILPAAFPMIANGLHMALGSAWVFLVAGEMVGAQSGLGFLIIDARNSLRSDLVLAGIIFIGISGLLLDKTIKLLESRIEKQWGVETGRKG